MVDSAAVVAGYATADLSDYGSICRLNSPAWGLGCGKVSASPERSARRAAAGARQPGAGLTAGYLTYFIVVFAIGLPLALRPLTVHLSFAGTSPSLTE